MLANGLSHMLFYLEISSGPSRFSLSIEFPVTDQLNDIIFSPYSTAAEHYLSIRASHPEHDVKGRWPPREYGLWQEYKQASSCYLVFWRDVAILIKGSPPHVYICPQS